MYDAPQKQTDANLDEELLNLESTFKNLSGDAFIERAVDMGTNQIMASNDFKAPRLRQISKFYRLYDGSVDKKLRQMFNIPIPVFAGMIDTLNAQYDTGIFLEFEPGDSADYFKTQKINGAWRIESMSTAKNSKWDSKLRMARQHAIMTGLGILEYNATSDPTYKSEINNVLLKDFNFQPRGGLQLENHLFCGTEDIEKTRSSLIEGAKSGLYNKRKVSELLTHASNSDYLSERHNGEMLAKLDRFTPLGLSPESHNFVGQEVYKLCQHIMEIDGQRYYMLFEPRTKICVRFEKWKDIDSSDLMPWVKFATHEDSENVLSKGYADDIYLASDAIVGMFNQEMTNREKKNFGARAFDKDMFPDVRKLDEAMSRPDALVPADTKGGTRQISEGIYEFKVGDLGGTVNLIDWITGSLGRNTGATDLAMGGTQDANKKASVTFAEQKSVSKRIGWGAQPYQDMIGDLGTRFVWGLKNHMPAKMAVQILGESGYDWDEITKLDLNTKKDVNILIKSTDEQQSDSEMKAKRRAEALSMLDPNTVNANWRNEQILKSVGEYDDEEVAQAQDMKTYHDRKSLAKASEMIQMILAGKKPEPWGGASVAFMQKIVDYASDKRSKLKEKHQELMDYAMSHKGIVKENIDRQMIEQKVAMGQQQMGQAMGEDGAPGAAPEGAGSIPPPPPAPTADNPGMTGGASRAMNMAEAAA